MGKKNKLIITGSRYQKRVTNLTRDVLFYRKEWPVMPMSFIDIVNGADAGVLPSPLAVRRPPASVRSRSKERR